MPDLLQPYALSIWCFLFIGGLLLVQLLIADVVGLTRGHVPGTAVAAAHESFHFRATRSHANTNESIASYILLGLAGMAVGADPQWLNGLSAAYCVSRVGHMVCYLAGWSIARSVSFVFSLLALFGMFAAGLTAVL